MLEERLKDGCVIWHKDGEYNFKWSGRVWTIYYHSRWVANAETIEGALDYVIKETE